MRPIICLICLAFLVSGCALFDSSRQMEKTADQLAADGASAFMNEKYRAAITEYTDLKDWYPFSRYAILAELKIADAHFQLKEYDQAIAAYDQFERMHPRNDAVPYVINQIGLCWFNQMDTVDRDITPAKNAMAQFKRLMEQFPDDEYAQEAPERIQTCIDKIAGHELYVAKFYMKTGQYHAGLKRLEHIVEFYPGTDQSKTALNLIPECAALAEDTEKE
ncbi:MAG: outer membrane protein assembly factor BamD [Desulfotignum sp.]|nr:outer membrane protein assembly factor BamD [Desulfotignum sp.]MCF8087154.1 outer membrane protein assembly factor BamD [Desulfotignum sp.]MCF8138033.1 outer membrane protein assembly factor BamD [Desulfotignum sp.]